MILLTLAFCWLASPDATQYAFYVDGVRNQVVTTTRASVSNLRHDGTYTFYVTALNNEGLESDPSESITFHAPRMKILGIGEFLYTRPIAKANQAFRVESSIDLATWTQEMDLEETVVSTEERTETIRVRVPTTDPHKFYRMRIEIIREGCAAE